MMKTRNIVHLLFAFLLIACLAATGCAKRQVTRGEADRLETHAKEMPVPPPDADLSKKSVPEIPVETPTVKDTPIAPTEKPTAVEKPPANAGDANKPAPFRPAPVPLIQKDEGSFENIGFDFDESVIREDAKPILLVIASYMKSHPNAKLTIEGHCDDRGTSEYNMALGQRRADATRAYLVNLGLSVDKMTTVSYGKERPLIQGHDEAAWSKNRRAVFLLTP